VCIAYGTNEEGLVVGFLVFFFFCLNCVLCVLHMVQMRRDWLWGFWFFFF
jgi:hypothetical protein